MRCLGCGNEITVATKFCEKCGLKLNETPQDVRNPTLAIVLSMVLPAVGQIYNNDFKKAFYFWTGYLLAFVLMFFGGIGIAVWVGVWIWSIVDAYQVASGKKYRDRTTDAAR